MPILHRDLETRSKANLKEAGHRRYAADPSTEVLCFAYAVDTSPAQLWMPGQPIPTEFVEAAQDPSWLVCAHNDAFESAVEELILAPRFRWPLVPLERHRCTMAMCAANALPRKLEIAADVLGLPQQKEKAGKRLIQKMVCGKELSEEELRQLYDYCCQDVEVERALYERLPPLTPEEQILWVLDQTINRRGFYVDRVLASAAYEIELKEKSFHKQELAALTNGQINSVGQIKLMKEMLKEQGYDHKSLNKNLIDAIIAQLPEGALRRVIEIRREAAKASKLKSLLNGLDTDSRLRGTFNFRAAKTGRFSGERFQPQNMKKPQGDIAAAIEAVRSGNIEQVRRLGPPLAVLSDISRSLICAAPSHVLIGADFSAIESRVLAWIAGEEWKLDAYRRFDETGDSALEPYCVTATRILGRSVIPDDEAGRKIGKTCDLAFGFGGTRIAFRKFDTTHSDAAVDKFCAGWRRAHRATRIFWYALEHGLRETFHTGERGTLRPFTFDCTGGVLFLTLPSGRQLAYPEARIESGGHGPYIAFKRMKDGKWRDERGWFGVFTENVVQAISGDILTEAMQRVEAAGYPVVLHIHDEIVCEIPKGFGSTEELQCLVTKLPKWATGLPIAAKPWTGLRYAKTQAPAPMAARAAPHVNGFHSLPDPPAQCIIAPATSPLVHLGGGKINCPFHDDSTPSLQIYDDHYHCFGCGAHGDMIDWLMKVEGMSILDAEKAVTTYTSAARNTRDQGNTYLPAALRYWNEAQPIAGTLAAHYLADVRRIDIAALPADVDLRFHPRCYFNGANLPCLLALLRDAITDKPTGIHRIALTPDVFAGGKVERRLLGRQGRGTVKLWPAGSELVIGEGIETVLAAATRLSQQPAWSAISAPALEKFPVLPGVQRLVILVDHDDAGKNAAAKCTERWRCAGRHVHCLMPRIPGTDFNDVIKGTVP
jgi:DNA polymerase